MSNKEGRGKEPSPTDTAFLDVVPDDQRVLTKTRAGRKAGVKGYLENPMTPTEAGEWVYQGNNVGVKLGDVESDDWTLVVVDVEQAGDLPVSATDVIEKCTLAVFESPHGGRNRLIQVTDNAYYRLDGVETKIDLDNDGEHEIELLTSVHALAPPSKVDHSRCKDGKDGCPGRGANKYELVEWNTDGDVMNKAKTNELLDALDITTTPEAEQTAGPEDYDWEVPDPNPARADEGEEVLRTLQKENVHSFLAVSDLLGGGTGRWDEDLTNEGGIDRSEQELLALTLLYQSAVELADVNPEQAREVTKATFEEYVSNNTYTEDGQPRKWLTRGKTYQNNRCREAFSRSHEFEKFLNRTAQDNTNNVTGQPGADGYSKVTCGVVLFAVDYLSGSLDLYIGDSPVEDLQEVARVYDLYIDAESIRTLLSMSPPSSVLGTDPPPGYVQITDYPSSNDICEVARTIDTQSSEPRSNDTYKTARTNLQQEGFLKQAYCPSRANGERYVYYPPYEPNPDDARYIKTENEKRLVGKKSPTESDSTLVTDGGTDFKRPSVPRGMGEDGTKELDPDDLEDHPKIKDRYPADKDRELDLDGEPRDPPKVTNDSAYTNADWTIIDGHRRIEALSEAGADTVEVKVVDTGDSKRGEMEAILEYNQYRSKTPGEKVIDAFDHILVLEDRVEEGLENFPSGYRSELDSLFTDSGRTLKRG